MRTVAIAATALLLCGCAGVNHAQQYQGVEVERFAWDGSTWRIFDKPSEGRLMITPTILRSARAGFFSGLTFGALDTDIPKPRYQGAVVSWIETSGRSGCTVTDGYEVVRPQWEFTYRCPAALVETMSVAALPPATAMNLSPARTVAERKSLGIVASNVTRQSSGPAVNLADPYGAFVNGVAPRSPAAEAGIQPGDIIRAFNGRRVSTFEELDAFAFEVAPGSRVILSVYRNRQIVDVELGL